MCGVYVWKVWYNWGMADETASMRALHIQVPEDLHTRLRRVAAENDRSVSAETRQAIKEVCDRHERDQVGAAA